MLVDSFLTDMCDHKQWNVILVSFRVEERRLRGVVQLSKKNHILFFSHGSFWQVKQQSPDWSCEHCEVKMLRFPSQAAFPAGMWLTCLWYQRLAGLCFGKRFHCEAEWEENCHWLGKRCPKWTPFLKRGIKEQAGVLFLCNKLYHWQETFFFHLHWDFHSLFTFMDISHKHVSEKNVDVLPWLLLCSFPLEFFSALWLVAVKKGFLLVLSQGRGM